MRGREVWYEVGEKTKIGFENFQLLGMNTGKRKKERERERERHKRRGKTSKNAGRRI